MHGTYVLIVEVSKSADIPIGKRQQYQFEVGYYAYAGSALNNLEMRIERHFRKEKKHHWHIDYLLDHAEVLQAIFAETTDKLECHIAREMLKNLEFKPGFGCSDCRCLSHLFYHKDFNILHETALNSFRAINLMPVEFSNGQSSSKALSSRSNSEGSMSCVST